MSARPDRPDLRRAALAAVLGAALGLGCGEPAPAPGPTERETRPHPTPAPPTRTPDPRAAGTESGAPPAAATPGGPSLDELEVLDALAEEPTEAAPTIVGEPSAEPPAVGCAVSEAPVRALAGADRPAAARANGAFFVAAYVGRDLGENVAIARVDDGRAPSLFATLPLGRPVSEGARRAPPAIAPTADGRLLVAATDADGALLFGELEIGATATVGALRVLVREAHADARFAPALVITGGATAAAWTDGSSTPMRVRVARIDRTGALLGEPVDVTPEAGGAAAPSPGRGSAEPTLFVVDPRVSISVVSRVTLAADATPGPTTVVRPLARAADPASFVVVGEGEMERIAYVAVGSSGTRAVGLLRARGSEPPVPVVPGLGFGEPISVDAAALGRGAVLAAEAPSAADPAAPHEVRVRALGPDGTLSEPLVLGAATEPAVAVSSDGTALVATRGGWVTRLRCRVE